MIEETPKETPAVPAAAAVAEVVITPTPAPIAPVAQQSKEEEEKKEMESPHQKQEEEVRREAEPPKAEPVKKDDAPPPAKKEEEAAQQTPEAKKVEEVKESPPRTAEVETPKTDGEKIVLTAVLEKLGAGLLKQWQPRRFELTESTLRWYVVGHTKERNSFQLSEVKNVHLDDNTKHKKDHIIRIETTQKVYHIGVPDKAAADQWIMHLGGDRR